MTKPQKPGYKLSDNFYKKLSEMCQRLNLNPADMLLVMYLESRLDPNVKSSAVGLTQFVGPTLKKYFKGGKEDFRKLKAEEQLPYIEKYFQDMISTFKLTNPTPAQFYIANFLPATLAYSGVKKRNKNTVLAEKNNDKKYSPDSKLTFHEAYIHNTGLDRDHDGKITYGDIERIMSGLSKQQGYQDALARLNNASGGAATQVAEQAPEEESGDLLSNISNFADKLVSNITQFTREIIASQQNFLIKISSPRLENNLEFARILSTACEDLSSAKCRLYANNQNVEVTCKIAAEMNAQPALNQLSSVLLQEFNKKTNIDDINIKIFANKSPSYHHLDVDTAEKNYRKFMFNLIGKKYD
jgi:hypothetical protein